MKEHKPVQRKLSELTNYESNSRTHSEKQVAQIVASIRTFGFTNPILIDETNTIIAGHARAQAAAIIGMAKVPCILLVGLDQHEKAALVITDNKLALNAGWNFDALKSEIDFLQDAGFDIEVTGFSIDDFIDSNDDFFDADEDDEKPDSMKKTDEGFSEFAMVMPSEQKAEIMQVLNAIKKDKGFEFLHEALFYAVKKHD
jgi:hypothetical protein